MAADFAKFVKGRTNASTFTDKIALGWIRAVLGIHRAVVVRLDETTRETLKFGGLEAATRRLAKPELLFIPLWHLSESIQRTNYVPSGPVTCFLRNVDTDNVQMEFIELLINRFHASKMATMTLERISHIIAAFNVFKAMEAFLSTPDGDKYKVPSGEPQAAPRPHPKVWEVMKCIRRGTSTALYSSQLKYVTDLLDIGKSAPRLAKIHEQDIFRSVLLQVDKDIENEKMRAAELADAEKAAEREKERAALKEQQRLIEIQMEELNLKTKTAAETEILAWNQKVENLNAASEAAHRIAVEEQKLKINAAWNLAAIEKLGSDGRFLWEYPTVEAFAEHASNGENGFNYNGFGGPVVIVCDPTTSPLQYPTFKKARDAPYTVLTMTEVDGEKVAEAIKLLRGSNSLVICRIMASSKQVTNIIIMIINNI